MEKPEFLKRMYDELSELNDFETSEFFKKTDERLKRLGNFLNENVYDESPAFKGTIELTDKDKTLLRKQSSEMQDFITHFKLYKRALTDRINQVENKLNGNEEE